VDQAAAGKRRLEHGVRVDRIRTNCPENEGPDADFGQPPILVTLASGKTVLTLGQKSAMVYGLES
jgi:hypothetical protein